jgi:hypothetical protein
MMQRRPQHLLPGNIHSFNANSVVNASVASCLLLQCEQITESHGLAAYGDSFKGLYLCREQIGELRDAEMGHTADSVWVRLAGRGS